MTSTVFLQSSPLNRIILILTGSLLLGACTQKDNTPSRISVIKDQMRRANFGAASIEVANLVQSRPDHLEARLLQGKISLAAGQAETAEAQLKYARDLGAPGRLINRALAQSILAQGYPERIDDVLGDEPEDQADRLAWFVAKGLAAVHTKRIADAEEYFTSVIHIEKSNLDGLLGLAAVQRTHGDLQAASVYAKNAAHNHPLSIAAWQAFGALRFEQGRVAEAEIAFNKAIEGTDALTRPREYLLAKVGLVETQWHLDKKSLAIQNIEKLIDSFPRHPLPSYTRGMLAFLDGDYAIANDYLSRVIATLPQHQPSLKLLAAISLIDGKLGRAQIYLAKNLSLNDRDPETLVLLGETTLKMGNASKTIATLKPLMRTDTQNDDLLDLFGTACLYAPSCSDGKRYLQRAVQLEPSNMHRQTRLAAAHLNQGEIAAADVLMKKWVRQENVPARSRQTLKLARLLRSNQLDSAIEFAKNRRVIEPKNLTALLTLAEIAYKRGDTRQEMIWLEIAREQNPTAVEPRLILATHHIQNQRYAAARDVAQEAASAHPYNISVLRILVHAHIGTENFDKALATANETYRLAPNQQKNLLALIHAHMMKNNQEKTQSLLKEFISQEVDSAHFIRPLIVDMHRHGLNSQAHEILNSAEQLGAQADAFAEIKGDLFLLEEKSAEARMAYTKANVLTTTRLRHTKMRMLSRDSNISSRLSNQ